MFVESLTAYRAKQTVQEQGGKVTHEFKLVKGFTYGPSKSLGSQVPRSKIHSAEFPADILHTMQSNQHIEVEADKEVRTQ